MLSPAASGKYPRHALAVMLSDVKHLGPELENSLVRVQAALAISHRRQNERDPLEQVRQELKDHGRGEAGDNNTPGDTHQPDIPTPPTRPPRLYERANPQDRQDTADRDTHQHQQHHKARRIFPSPPPHKARGSQIARQNRRHQGKGILRIH